MGITLRAAGRAMGGPSGALLVFVLALAALVPDVVLVAKREMRMFGQM